MRQSKRRKAAVLLALLNKLDFYGHPSSSDQSKTEEIRLLL